jgi:TRAP-type C4-dicarboxylate transport system permease small subunit
MSRQRRSFFIVASLITLSLLGLTGWGMLQNLEASCKRQEQHSGLWAECIAPAALIFSALFALMFIIDLIRIALVLWASKPEKE